MNLLARTVIAPVAAIPPMCPVCYRKPCVCGNMLTLSPVAEGAAVCAKCGQVYASCTCPKWPAPTSRVLATAGGPSLSAICNRCGNPAGSCTCRRG